MGDSLRYWQLARLIEEFTDQYAAGRLDDAATTLKKIEARIEAK
jgi:hypothetical protein